MSKFWIDKYGVIWQRLRGGYYVWNRFTGKGLWDSGKGLEPYYDSKSHTKYWNDRRLARKALGGES